MCIDHIRFLYDHDMVGDQDPLVKLQKVFLELDFLRNLWKFKNSSGSQVLHWTSSGREDFRKFRTSKLKQGLPVNRIAKECFWICFCIKN